ncbi:SH3-domain binding protein 2 [Mactra antiquata]
MGSCQPLMKNLDYHLTVSRSRSNSPVQMAEGTGECDILLPMDNISCQNLLEEQCTHCGWLRKRRTLNFFSWPQAYVVIHNGCIYYFRNEGSKKAAGKFSLYGYNGVYRASEILAKEAIWCFKIVHTHMDFKTYYFGAASEQEMKIWMGKIKLELMKANGRSNLYGKNLQVVKEDKEDKFEDDPKFYEKIEANIYEDSTKFIPSKDYEKKCSIKKQNDDSDDEEIEVNDAINFRPPAPLPPQDPFITLKTPHAFKIEEPPDIVTNPYKAPSKPPRVEELPTVPPRPKKDNEITGRIQHMTKMFETPGLIKSPKHKRRGSYVQTDGPGNKSPSGTGHGDNIRIGNYGGSSGDDENHSDNDDYLTNFYFDEKDSKKASDIILGIGEQGVYLVRPERSGEGKVLVVCYDGQTKKYKIQYQNGMYFLAKEGYHHSCLDLMLKHYHENCLPTISVLLTTPYKLHPAYKHLQV